MNEQNDFLLNQNRVEARKIHSRALTVFSTTGSISAKKKSIY